MRNLAHGPEDIAQPPQKGGRNRALLAWRGSKQANRLRITSNNLKIEQKVWILGVAMPVKDTKMSL